MNAVRCAEWKRTTLETDIFAEINLDGSGQSDVHTGIGFLDHMLTLFAKHGFFDLKVSVKGDLEVDYHHKMEDLGLVLGNLIRRAAGDKAGIRRYGNMILPMDETLVLVALDLSGRPCLVWDVDFPAPGMIRDLDVRLFHEFFLALVNKSGMNLHVKKLAGEEMHHVAEAIFKAFAKALDQATAIDPRVVGVLSTKGSL